MCVFQNAHIDLLLSKKIKTVANLSNNKDVFMCILCFHACAGYLQHYQTLTLLKELQVQVNSELCRGVRTIQGRHACQMLSI
jgi:hypothetical protein